MDTSSRYNKYDISLFLIIVSTIFGSYGLFHPTTFLSIWFLPLLIRNSYLFKLKHIKPIISFLLLWIVYAFVSFLWTPPKAQGVRGIILLLINSLIFLEIIVFATKANRPVQIITKAWVCAFLLTSVIALWEIGFGQHLSSARIESNSYVDSHGDVYATVTFYNPNTYCCFMSLSFPFILYRLSQSKGRGQLFGNIGIVLLLIFIMSRNSSRGGLLTLLVMISTYFIFKLKRGSYRKKLFMLLGLTVIVIIFVLYGELLFSTLFYRMSQHDLLEDNARLILWWSSWLLFVDSNGLGTGVGSMCYVLGHTDENPFDVVYSHSMIFEILLEYGVIVAIILFLFLFKLYKNARKMTDNASKSIVIGSLLSFPLYSVINSENVCLFFMWIFFATLYILSNYSIDNKVNNENSFCDKRLPV